jgi:agmatine deiminase
VADSPAVVFHHFPTNDAWCRDHGAIFVRDQAGRLAAVDCGFNAWGGKYPPWDLDDAVPARMAEALGLPRFEGGLVLEGGSIDVNGAGSLLTTEQCLLNENRNPELSREDIEARLELLFGVEQVLWLGDGIVGDDTDGHVDDITRFVAEDTVSPWSSPTRGSEPRAAGREPGTAARDAAADGRPLEIIELPMPGPVELEGVRLPASYGNFYIGNAVVLLPVFGQPADEQAGRMLACCFPGRRVVPIRANELVVGLGAFHCLTQQVPAARPEALLAAAGTLA